MSTPIRDLGPCAVIFDSVDLGKTQGGVIFRHTEEDRPVREDQSGVSNVDDIAVGATCNVEVPLTRSSLGQLAKVIGASSYTGSKLKVRVNVGLSRLSLAKQLILKPVVNGVTSTTQSEWLTIGKAFAKPDFELAYNNEGQRVYKVIFTAYPDSTNSNEMWRIG